MQIDHQLESTSSEPKESWDKANDDAKLLYQTTLAYGLNNIQVHPDCLSCQDFHCKTHTEGIEECTMKVLEAISLHVNSVFHLQVDLKWGVGFLSLAGLSQGAIKLVSVVSSMRLVRHCGLKTTRKLRHNWLDSVH